MHRSDLPPAPFDVAHASYTEIGQGAQAVHDRCTMGRPFNGGIASNIGECQRERCKE